MLKTRKQVIHRVTMSLEGYLKPITSPSGQWITFLNLMDVTLLRSDMISISQLTNIGALTIGHGVHVPNLGMDDSILRSWARAAKDLNAFSMLRVLACRRQRQLGALAFEYISNLPALTALVLEDCSLGPHSTHVADIYGWKYNTGRALSKSLKKMGCTSDSWDCVLKVLYTFGTGAPSEISTASPDEGTDPPLTLELSLGGEPEHATIVEAGMSGKNSLYCFHRRTATRLKDSESSELTTNVKAQHLLNAEKKRSRNHALDQRPKKRRVVKESRQTNVESAFAEFGLE